MKCVDEDNKISKKELVEMSENMFGDLVKAVVDIEQGVMIVDAGLHADEEEELLEKHNSEQKNLWVINLYPNEEEEYFVEFDSMINLRPSYGNKSRGVDDESIQKKIIEVVNKLVKK